MTWLPNHLQHERTTQGDGALALVTQLLLFQFLCFPLGCDSPTPTPAPNHRKCFCFVTVVKLGAEQVTLVWMDSLCVAHHRRCPGLLSTYHEHVQMEQAQVQFAGFFRSAGGQDGLPGWAALTELIIQ